MRIVNANRTSGLYPFLDIASWGFWWCRRGGVLSCHALSQTGFGLNMVGGILRWGPQFLPCEVGQNDPGSLGAWELGILRSCGSRE
jgi:hypothetical protein